MVIGGIGFGACLRSTPVQGATRCFQDSDCVGGAMEPCAGARCDGGACTFFLVSCVPGYVCCGNGACCPTATATGLTGAACPVTTDDPCGGTRCENGTCVPYLLSCAPGFVCGQGAGAPAGENDPDGDPCGAGTQRLPPIRWEGSGQPAVSGMTRVA